MLVEGSIKEMWVIAATVGCYSDLSEWIVAILPTGEEARLAIAAIEDFYRNHPRLTDDDEDPTYYDRGYIKDEKGEFTKAANKVRKRPSGFYRPAAWQKATCPFDPYGMVQSPRETPDYVCYPVPFYSLESFLALRTTKGIK